MDTDHRFYSENPASSWYTGDRKNPRPPARFTKYETHGAYHWKQYEKGTKYKRHADRVKAWVKEKSVLDIGAGDGLITSLMGAKGIEYEESGVKLARDRGVDVVQGDAYQLPYPDNSFDAVTMIDVLEHFEFPQKALQEAYRVARDALYINTPPKKDDGTLTDKFHYQEWSPHGLMTLVESQGFQLEDGVLVFPNEKTMYAKFRKIKKEMPATTPERGANEIKVSIIIPVLNSHEIVRRQILHFEKIGIPEDTEIIIVDDGSNPAIEVHTDLPLTILKTNDFREWTWPCARNAGARIARGEYLIMVDLDHIISRELIDCVRAFHGDQVRFNREFGVLTEDGTLTQDTAVLEAYGWPRSRFETRGVKCTPHRNQLAMHRDLYWKLGGYREDRIGQPYPQREDGDFSNARDRLYDKGEIKDFDDVVGYEKRPVLYMIPNGKYCGDVDHNPFNLFHGLTRKTKRNPYCKIPS